MIIDLRIDPYRWMLKSSINILMLCFSTSPFFRLSVTDWILLRYFGFSATSIIKARSDSVKFFFTGHYFRSNKRLFNALTICELSHRTSLNPNFVTHICELFSYLPSKLLCGSFHFNIFKMKWTFKVCLGLRVVFTIAILIAFLIAVFKPV